MKKVSRAMPLNGTRVKIYRDCRLANCSSCSSIFGEVGMGHRQAALQVSLHEDLFMVL
jgi:hypothetical protein